MRYLISFLVLFGALLFAIPAHAESTPQSQVKALMEYCIPAVEAKTDPAAYALDKKLPEMPAEQAIKFSPEGGRVFAIPTDIGNAVMMTNKNHEGICSIAIRETEKEAFWELVHKTFNKQSGYRLLHERRMEAERVSRKDFEKQTPSGAVVLLVSVADKPRNGGMQALMTYARVKEEAVP